jgi:hypothetical protein
LLVRFCISICIFPCVLSCYQVLLELSGDVLKMEED